MASAVIKGLEHQDLVAPGQIVASGPPPERGQQLHAQCGVHTSTDSIEAAADAETVVLSTKT